MEQPQFPCCQCGACCRATVKFPDAILAAEGIRRGPMGWCEHLQDDNRCAIYETRPRLCRVADVARGWGIPATEGYRLSAHGCDALMEREGDTLAGLMSRRVALVMPHAVQSA